MNIWLSYRYKYPFFKRVLISMYALQVLGRHFEEPRLTQGRMMVAMYSIFESGHDNFIGISADGF